ncbi:Vitamin B12 import ATP-binding protein BtuD [Streptomyces sp. RB5]|uniref:Vitamin B12 import ATP-binding protein BtuD n=1 Tax=Streptomyces smaragdinus TaxID=2585196 RepID=A0A7K0CII9_9ACTN|nr:ATP-binding cassette domain-containing protein [Streptomyces smaragdinus]MQY13163.1 Vitamin B12 import ATP-binding protein BtuD [Streptomyces smaragdinus]
MASLTYDLTLAGLAVGSAAALTGIGLIVTYRATGVLNFAHGAVAMVTAYALWQLRVGWGWPLWAAAALCLVVVAPGIGLLLGRFVFRPLSVLQGRGGAHSLVVSLGVFVLLVGGAGLVWGTGAKTDVPRILPDDPWIRLSVVVVLAAAVSGVTRFTRVGRELRAVVDDRRLAALSGIDADRVADTGWAFGTFTAGLTGLLLAPYVRLDPYGLPLLVTAVLGVAVAAGLRSLPVAVGVALAIGVAQSQLTRLHPGGGWEQVTQALGANLFAVALLVAALAVPRLGEEADREGFFRVPPAPAAGGGAVGVLAGVLFLLPLGFAGADLTTAVQVPGLAVVLLSLVVVTGRGGQVSLGQAGYAGLGALFTALLAAGRFPGVGPLPEAAALGFCVLLVAPLGLLTGYPAIRRRGLALALTTLAFGVGVSAFVLTQPYAAAGLSPARPAGFTGDRAYYALELALLAGAVLVVWLLRRGRTGRALAALRDHEEGASAAGVAVPALTVGAFVAGAALAALGGGMLVMGVQAFSPGMFDPVRGLLWFAAVVVLGADSVPGALAAAALLVGLDAGARGGTAAAVIGVLAVLLGRFPGGVYDALRAGLARVRGPGVRLSGAGRRVRGRLGRTTVEPRSAATRVPPGRTEPRIPPGETRPSPLPPPAPPARPESSPPARLTARGVRVAYGDYLALDGVDLTVAPGRITALTGPNGAGKSTLFHCLAGTLTPGGGRILLDGTDVTREPAHRRTRRGIARTFQRLAVFPSLTVGENVRIGAEQGRLHDPAATDRALALLGLTPVRDRPAAGLPTGTLRRVELARALAGGPRVLLLDEPAAGLDTAETAALARLLRALAADGMALLVVEHDPDLVAGLAATVYEMEAGRITAVREGAAR